jgi:large subunit ribosomal protein L9
MKMILVQDVKSVGKKGDLVNVSEGYAKNFLLPKNWVWKQQNPT